MRSLFTRFSPPMLLLMASFFMLNACGDLSSKLPTIETIDNMIAEGRFSEAKKMIALLPLVNDSLSEQQRYDLNFKIDLMDRIRQDFSVHDTTLLSYIKQHYPEVTPEEIAQWEASNAIENMTIDGKKLYFNSAGRNLFRIDSLAAKHYKLPNGGQSDSLNRFLKWYIPKILNIDKSLTIKNGAGIYFAPVKMRIKYSITVNPDEVPSGETVRVWMPYPRRDAGSHIGIKLLSTTQPQYIISPSEYLHSSIYMEGVVSAGEPTLFGFELEYTSYAQWYDFKPESVADYNKESTLYKEFTSEQAPHILFSDNIRAAVEEVVGSEANPYLKAKKIYEWIDKNFPWASAREYSTIPNIPEYVLANKHGDCGQVTLLFITMARYAGIPAKWQSGWMMHPGNRNLHDWAEAYFEGIGWVPVDQSFGRVWGNESDPKVYFFYTKGLDPYRLIVNDDISRPFYPAKIYSRSETVDFQRGEVEWNGGNLYFGRWRYRMEIAYLSENINI